MKPTVFCVIALILAFLAASSLAQQPASNPYESRPARFNIPEDETRLTAWVGVMNIAELRRHGWQILAGLTAPSDSRRQGNDGMLPVWETWYSQPETFRPASADVRKLGPVFEYPPDQLTPPPGAEARVVSVAARILFNQQAHDHIQRNCLYLQSKLQCLHDAGPKPASAAQPATLEIPDFPRESIALKTAWMHVTRKCTQIPVWDGEPTFPPSTTNPPLGWHRRVWVYPPSVSPSTCGEGRRVPIERFYHFQITDKDEVSRWQQTPAVLLDPETGALRQNDYVVLVGLHAATRELAKWVWATYWWHDQPDSALFGSDRPGSIRGPWRNYLMDVAYDMDTPAEHDTSPKITFNPYLEAALAEGVRSNCMTCHRRAVYPDKPNVVTNYSFGDKIQPNQMVVRGSEAATATYLSDFDSRLKLHFIWSLAAHSLTSDPTPLPAGCGCLTSK